MVLYQYYHRKTVKTTETEFFNQSIATADNKELDTNMVKEYMMVKDFAVDRIIMFIPGKEYRIAAYATAPILPDQIRLVNEGVLEVHIGDLPKKYYRVSECLDNIALGGCVSLKQREATNDLYQLASIYPANGEKGRETDFTIPADTNFYITLKTITMPADVVVTLILSGSE